MTGLFMAQTFDAIEADLDTLNGLFEAAGLDALGGLIDNPVESDRGRPYGVVTTIGARGAENVFGNWGHSVPWAILLHVDGGERDALAYEGILIARLTSPEFIAALRAAVTDVPIDWWRFAGGSSQGPSPDARNAATWVIGATFTARYQFRGGE